MILKHAEKEVEMALQGYVDDCISSDKKAIKKLELAWRTILAEVGSLRKDLHNAYKRINNN